MNILNVSFGIFALMPQGWLFMLFVVVIESLLISKFLCRKWSNPKIYLTTILANAISGIVGFATSIALNGGWWLVVWFPWVSSHEVDIFNPESFKWLAIYYLCAFVVTIVIETLFNWLLLRKQYAVKRIIASSLLANVVSYIVGSAVLYTYSFSLL